MVQYILWSSRCHGSRIINILSFIPLFFLLAIPFSIYFFGFGAVAITMISLFVVTISIFAVFGRKYRWINPNLSFAFTDEGIMFTSKQKNNSYFSDDYSNLAGYNYILEADGFTTVIIYFKTPSNAGFYGNLRYLKMVKIEEFDKLQAILSARNIDIIKPK